MQAGGAPTFRQLPHILFSKSIIPNGQKIAREISVVGKFRSAKRIDKFGKVTYNKDGRKMMLLFIHTLSPKRNPRRCDSWGFCSLSWSCDHIGRRGLTPPWAGLLPVAFSPSCCPTTCRCNTRLPLPKQKARMMLLHTYFVTSPHAEGSAAKTVYQNRPDSTRFAGIFAKKRAPE